MSKQYILTVSYDGQEEVNCTPLSTQESGLGLGEEGLSWMESSFATITVDDHDELVITRTGSVPVSLQRNGRKLELVSNHPTRLLAQDLLQWNTNHTHHTFEIKKIYRQNFVSKLLSRLSKHAMITTAAAMLLGVVPGCDVSRNQTKGDIAPIPAENETVVPSVEKGQIVPIPAENETVVPSVEKGKMVVDEDPAQVPMDVNRVAGDAEIAPPNKNDTVVPSRQEGKIAVDEESPKDNTVTPSLVEGKMLVDEEPPKDNTVTPSLVEGKMVVDEESADPSKPCANDCSDTLRQVPPQEIDVGAHYKGDVQAIVPANNQAPDANTPAAAPSDGDENIVLPPPELTDPPQPDTPKVVPPVPKGLPTRPEAVPPPKVDQDRTSGKKRGS